MERGPAVLFYTLLYRKNYTEKESEQEQRTLLSRASAKIFLELTLDLPKCVVKTDEDVQIMKLGIVDSAKKVSSTWIAIMTKDESHHLRNPS